MKVGILTLPLHSNFGYLMQNYALQQVVIQLGHEPYTYQIWDTIPNKREQFISIIKRFALKYFFKKISGPIIIKYNSIEEQAIIDQNTILFVKKYLQLSPRLNNIKDIRKLKNEYDACIVGSDQVWRRWYAPRIQTYFFAFLPFTVKRTSYAASFGLSYVEYNETQKKECGEALKLFSGISVREKDGIEICKNEWGLDAVSLIDPTMLLSKEEYLKLINPSEVLDIPDTPFLLCYLLDETDEKETFIESFAKNNGLLIFKIKPEKYNRKNDIRDSIFPSISMWLESFNRASYVITDSFHGTAFSIIFQKQFLTIANVKRGLCRFTSLLDELHLSDRLIYDTNTYKMNPYIIDYVNVNIFLNRKVKEGVSFLNIFLNESY